MAVTKGDSNPGSLLLWSAPTQAPGTSGDLERGQGRVLKIPALGVQRPRSGMKHSQEIGALDVA